MINSLVPRNLVLSYFQVRVKALAVEMTKPFLQLKNMHALVE